MSFSSNIKEELIAHKPEHRHCERYEFMAILRANGSISPQHGTRLIIRTEQAAVARRVFTMIRELYSIQAEIRQGEGKRFDKRHSYAIVVDGEDARRILLDCGVIRMKEGVMELCPFDEGEIQRRCCRAAFLRGCYLSCGSLSNPQKIYHLEFVLQDRELAQSICRLLAHFQIDKAKIIERKGTFVVYLKDSESIADFLTVIGAHEATLELENIRVLKDVINNVNRAVNCETANLEKTVTASCRQQENIQYIIKHMGLEKLPPKLREVAEVRLNYPDATLSELAEHLSEPLGKSGINHRLRRIDEIAKDLMIKRGDA